MDSPDGDRAPWEGEDEWETARAAHRLLTIALLRSFDGRVVASHQSALVLHGVRLWKSDLATAHVCRSEDDHTRRRKAAVLHPACGQGEPGARSARPAVLELLRAFWKRSSAEMLTASPDPGVLRDLRSLLVD